MRSDQPRSTRSDTDENRSICLAPWVHLHITLNGSVTPCCRISKPFGNVNREEMEAIWNGPMLRSLRRQFLSGIKPEICWRCHAHEDAGKTSYREFVNDRFSHHAHQISATNTDGSLDGARPVYWDIRFSNICNFRCRTCWHGASSRWYGDAVKLGTTVAGQAIIQNIENSDEFLDKLVLFAPDVEEIVFAGGEPMITSEHYTILNKLIERDMRSINLRYVTNLSELRYKQNDIIDLWNQFENVQVNASLDGVGKVGELVRKDLSWERYLANAKRVRNEAPHVKFGIDTTVSVLNIFHLPEMQQTLLSENLVTPNQIELRPLLDPPHYNIQMLPSRMKAAAERILREQMNWISDYCQETGQSPQTVSDAQQQLEILIHFMNAGDLTQHLFRFSQVTKSIDAIRSESTSDICPELRVLIDRPFTVSAHGTGKFMLGQLAAKARKLVNMRARD